MHIHLSILLRGDTMPTYLSQRPLTCPERDTPRHGPGQSPRHTGGKNPRGEKNPGGTRPGPARVPPGIPPGDPPCVPGGSSRDHIGRSSVIGGAHMSRAQEPPISVPPSHRWEVLGGLRPLPRPYCAISAPRAEPQSSRASDPRLPSRLGLPPAPHTQPCGLAMSLPGLPNGRYMVPRVYIEAATRGITSGIAYGRIKVATRGITEGIANGRPINHPPCVYRL